MDELKSESAQSYTEARNSLLAYSTIGILISVLVSLYTGHRIASNLRKLSKYARDVHDARDLSRPLPNVSNDEVGRVADAFDGMRQTVYSQTAELANLNDALADKSQEMEQFVYTVSHDLKSPLVSCKGLIGLMREDLADESYEDVIDSANRLDGATDQLSQIIDDLLALSRIGRKSLDINYVNVDELVTELGEELKHRLDEVRR